MPKGIKFDKAKWEATKAKREAAKARLAADSTANPNQAVKVKDLIEAMG